MSLQTDLEALIRKALPASCSLLPLRLEKPDSDFGDLATNIAMVAFARVKDDFASPRAFAEDLASKIQSSDQGKLLKTVTVAGPGFINFQLNEQYLFAYLSQVLSQSKLPLLNLGQGRSAIVDYSSPNIAKPFTIGHLRSTIIGDCVANLLEASGYKVFRDNHLGDWGTQFGKQIVAIKKWGDEEAIARAKRPVEELVKLYVKFHAEAEKEPQLEEEGRHWFKKLEDGDVEARRLWGLCVAWSLKEFKQIYQRLGVKFTENPDNGYYGYGESYFEPFLQEVIKDLIAAGVAKKGKDGAYLVFFEDEKLPPLMIQKKDGATLYATRDLATDKWRRENPRYQNTGGQAPLIINEVGAEQALYFQQIFTTEVMMGWYKAGDRVHVKHGLYRFKAGKMSTRKGNVIWLEEVLDKAEEKAKELSQKATVAKEVSIGALKWNDLKRKAELNISFDWDEILNLQGNSGPYLQYSYARAKSVLRKAEAAGIALTSSVSERALNQQEKQLLSLAYDFAEVVARASKEYAPHYLCNYLFELAQSFNSFYNQWPILSDTPERLLRLQLTQLTSMILAQGLQLLGISVLEEM